MPDLAVGQCGEIIRRSRLWRIVQLVSFFPARQAGIRAWSPDQGYQPALRRIRRGDFVLWKEI